MRLLRLLLCSGLLAVAGPAGSLSPQAARSSPPEGAALPQDEATALLEQLGLPNDTKLTLATRAKLPNGAMKVAIDCELDADVRMRFTSWIKDWNRTQTRRLVVSPELETANVVLARAVRRGQVQLGTERHTVVVADHWPPTLDDRAPPALAVTHSHEAHDRAPFFAYVLVKVPGGYDVAWRFAGLAEIDSKTEGWELWNAFRTLLLTRKGR